MSDALIVQLGSGLTARSLQQRLLQLVVVLVTVTQYVPAVLTETHRVVRPSTPEPSQTQERLASSGAQNWPDWPVQTLSGPLMVQLGSGLTARSLQQRLLQLVVVSVTVTQYVPAVLTETHRVVRPSTPEPSQTQERLASSGAQNWPVWPAQMAAGPLMSQLGLAFTAAGASLKSIMFDVGGPVWDVPLTQSEPT